MNGSLHTQMIKLTAKQLTVFFRLTEGCNIITLTNCSIGDECSLIHEIACSSDNIIKMPIRFCFFYYTFFVYSIVLAQDKQHKLSTF